MQCEERRHSPPRWCSLVTCYASYCYLFMQVVAIWCRAWLRSAIKIACECLRCNACYVLSWAAHPGSAGHRACAVLLHSTPPKSPARRLELCEIEARSVVSSVWGEFWVIVCMEQGEMRGGEVGVGDEWSATCWAAHPGSAGHFYSLDNWTIQSSYL